MTSRITKKILTSLTTAAMALPALSEAVANGAPKLSAPKAADTKAWYNDITVDAKYTRYTEDGPRYDIDVWQAHIVMPVDQFRYTVDIQRDSQTGSSQLVIFPGAFFGGPLDSLTAFRTGASIVDTRNEIKFRTEYLEQDAKYDVTAYYSSENDLVVPALSAQGQWGFNKNNTQLIAGLGATYEKSIPSQTNESTDRVRPRGQRTIQKYYLGLRQDLSKYNYVYLSTEYQYSHGDLSDPYYHVASGGNVTQFPGIAYFPAGALGPIAPAGIGILFEKRPNNRSIWMPLVRFVQFIPGTDSSLHFQYRFGADDWHMRSHTFELQYFQPIGSKWQLQPLIRYYSQSAVDFYGPIYNYGAVPVPWPSAPLTTRGWTNDWRLSTYGTMNIELKATYKAFDFMDIGLTAGYYKARPVWSMSSADRIPNPALPRKGFGAQYFSANLNFKL